MPGRVPEPASLLVWLVSTSAHPAALFQHDFVPPFIVTHFVDKIIDYNNVHWSGDQLVELQLSWVCLLTNWEPYQNYENWSFKS